MVVIIFCFISNFLFMYKIGLFNKFVIKNVKIKGSNIENVYFFNNISKFNIIIK